MKTENIGTYLAAKTSVKFPKTYAQCSSILQMVDNDLSPENLTCDGELSGMVLARKARFLMRVRCELVELRKGMKA